MIVVATAVLAFAAWQLVMPPGFVSVRGLNPGAVKAWRALLGQGWPEAKPLPIATYALGFRACLVVAWAGYGGLLWFVARGGRLGAGWTWPLAIPLMTVLAIAMPASLSTDVFAYVGYGRLAIVHGMNPYLHTQLDLIRLADPTAPYLNWPIASPYGPTWTLISMATAFGGELLAMGGGETAARAVVVPVIVLKLFAGGALLGTAGAARALVRRQGGDPKLAITVFVLVALNPLLLVEGPGNGHNDLTMVALVMAGFALLAAGRTKGAALAMGLAATIKVVPIVVVPWLVMLAVRMAPPHWRSRVWAAALTLALSVGPIVLAYAPFWSGPRTFDGVAARWRHADASIGTGRADTRAAPPGATPPVMPTATTSSPVGPFKAAVGLAMRIALRIWPAVLIYLWASLAICLGEGAASLRLATVWSIVALAVMLFVAGLWFPWYLAWLWPTLVLRFTRLHLSLAGFALPFSLLVMLAYAMAPG